METDIIIADKISKYYDGRAVLNELSFQMSPRSVVALIGGSGSGKTTFLRTLLQLETIDEGGISILGQSMGSVDFRTLQNIRRRWGVMFQHSALFSSYTVLENVMFPLDEFTDISTSFKKEIALYKLNMVGINTADANKRPSLLSGGMKKRVAVARALVMDPEIIFLDEPTAGLDPYSADLFDELIMELKELLNLSMLMITHDLDTIATVADTVAFLGEGHILSHAPLAKLLSNTHPLIQSYFPVIGETNIVRICYDRHEYKWVMGKE